MLVLDTNVYIDAMEDPALGERLATAVEASEDPVGVSSVVVAELLIGLKDPARKSELLRHVVGESDAVLTPVDADWRIAGHALRSLGGNAATRRRSFWNDVLIAASCRRAGATLLTSNRGDFKRIRGVIPVETLAAWDHA